jgi:hypothetical protein
MWKSLWVTHLLSFVLSHWRYGLWVNLKKCRMNQTFIEVSQKSFFSIWKTLNIFFGAIQIWSWNSSFIFRSDNGQIKNSNLSSRIFANLIWWNDFYFLGRKQNLCLATAVVTLPCCIKVSSKWNLLSQKIEILFSSFFAKIFKCVRQSGVIGFDWRKEEIILEPKT